MGLYRLRGDHEEGPQVQALRVAVPQAVRDGRRQQRRQERRRQRHAGHDLRNTMTAK